MQQSLPTQSSPYVSGPQALSLSGSNSPLQNLVPAQKQRELWNLSEWMFKKHPEKSQEEHYQELMLIENMKIKIDEVDPPLDEKEELRHG
jgi:hypothetical protein